MKKVDMPVKYTDNAKLFISFISIGIVGCALLLFFIVYEPDTKIVTYFLLDEYSSFTCNARNFIGYVDANDFAQYIKIIGSTRYSMYCLKKMETGQWSVYAN
ncbi:hypothetical protein B1Q45_14280 [Salmonella enterica]|nr:hypothetical protein [Salmonella enterica]EBV8286616.1 hypothetical protein [Salmonella enterica subsp. arizonae serovar 18:z4,z23:-]EBV9430382.1 hypothetical protein [Salmonella enterica subsp. enterica serovar Heidelberg]ECC3300040.1 hypothetical protein [Salmonella enterica subsp. arizonae]ECE0066285.1 hypothetical protein [Salmonella enterica subsp. enterica]ECU7348171.1 hypothetical protein [Salmonella enterica subsp. enterica serovar Kentucky]EDB5609110.1 hypothetical protein [Salmon